MSEEKIAKKTHVDSILKDYDNFTGCHLFCRKYMDRHSTDAAQGYKIPNTLKIIHDACLYKYGEKICKRCQRRTGNFSSTGAEPRAAPSYARNALVGPKTRALHQKY